jgi:hypothetical protein
MAIEAVFLRLVTASEALHDALHSLGLTVIEDRPRYDAVLLVERLGDLVDDLRGLSLEGLVAAKEAQQAVAHPFDWYRARCALGEANERFIRLKHRFVDEAASHEAIDGLMRFGRERGYQWLAWSRSVVLALHGCRAPLRVLDASSLEAWQELSERLGMRSVSVQTTSIGQQFGAVLTERQHADRPAHDGPAK